MQQRQKEKTYDYEVLLSVVLFLLILFVFLRGRFAWAEYLLYVSMFLGIASLLSKSFAGLLTKAWGKLMAGIGFINSRIILSLTFFLILFPVSILSKLFRKDQLQLKQKDQSYFVERNHTYTGKDIENMW